MFPISPCHSLTVPISVQQSLSIVNSSHQFPSVPNSTSVLNSSHHSPLVPHSPQTVSVNPRQSLSAPISLITSSITVTFYLSTSILNSIPVCTQPSHSVLINPRFYPSVLSVPTVRNTSVSNNQLHSLTISPQQSLKSVTPQQSMSVLNSSHHSPSVLNSPQQFVSVPNSLCWMEPTGPCQSSSAPVGRNPTVPFGPHQSMSCPITPRQSSTVPVSPHQFLTIPISFHQSPSVLNSPNCSLQSSTVHISPQHSI